MTDAEPPAPAIPAATLVIFRDRKDGPPELLMVERAKGMAFAAGALVFPGGRVDPGDHVLAATFGEDQEWEMAARIAAIRETIEEAGIAIGVVPALSSGAIRSLRADLHAGMPFGDALAKIGARIDPAALIPFARWRPAHRHMRIFDTRFYLAAIPADAPIASVDATENVRLCWASAQSVLDDADAGQVTIIFPTRRNLERLAQFDSFSAAADDAGRYPARTITPWSEDRDGAAHLCIPDDLGYPVTSEAMARAMRG